jgi:ATP-binding cassette, subfamily C, bacterial CydC
MKALLYFLPLLRRKRFELALTVFLSLLTLAAGVALLGLSGWFITAAALSAAGALFNILAPSAGVRGLSFIRIVSRYAERYSGHAVTLGLVSQTRAWLFDRLFKRVPLPQNLGRADVVSRLVADLDMVDNIFLVALGPMTTALLTAVMMGVGLGLLLPGAALPFVAFYVLATLGVPLWLLWRTREGAIASVAASAGLRSALLEGLDGHRDLALFGQLSRLVDRTDAAGAQLRDAKVRIGKVAARASLAVQLLSGAALVAVLLGGLGTYAAGGIDGALLVGVVLAALASFEAAQALVRSVTRLTSSIAAAERVMDLAEGPGEAAVADPRMPSGEGRISMSEVTFAYPGALAPLLDRFSMDVAPHERVALCGASGSGKSTVAGLLVRLLTPQAGTLSLDGVDISRIDPAELRRLVAVMMQDAPVFADTVGNNLRLARPDASDDELWDGLRRVGLANEVAAAGGLRTQVGEGGLSLSTGQARRLALARTLMCEAEVVVLDEPTAGLDPEAEARFFNLLGEITLERTLIVITHARDLSGFDRVLTLRAGRIEQVRTRSADQSMHD